MSSGSRVTIQRSSTAPERAYVPEEAVTRQLASYAAVPLNKLEAALFRREVQTGEKVCEETLVVLLRRCAVAGDEDTAWRIALEIAERVKGRIARTVRLWRLDKPESAAEDVIGDIVAALYEALFDTSRRERFWEIRFWVAFDRRMLKIVQSRRAAVDSVADLGSGFEDRQEAIDSRSYNGSVAAGFDLGGGLREPLTGALVGEALALLTGKERTAFILKHVARIPEGSGKEDAPMTIASVLNVSPRTVRNYLSRAEKALSDWRLQTTAAEVGASARS